MTDQMNPQAKRLPWLCRVKWCRPTVPRFGVLIDSEEANKKKNRPEVYLKEVYRVCEICGRKGASSYYEIPKREVDI